MASKHPRLAFDLIERRLLRSPSRQCLRCFHVSATRASGGDQVNVANAAPAASPTQKPNRQQRASRIADAISSAHRARPEPILPLTELVPEVNEAPTPSAAAPELTAPNPTPATQPVVQRKPPTTVSGQSAASAPRPVSQSKSRRVRNRDKRLAEKTAAREIRAQFPMHAPARVREWDHSEKSLVLTSGVGISTPTAVNGTALIFDRLSLLDPGRSAAGRGSLVGGLRSSRNAEIRAKLRLRQPVFRRAKHPPSSQRLSAKITQKLINRLVAGKYYNRQTLFPPKKEGSVGGVAKPAAATLVLESIQRMSTLNGSYTQTDSARLMRKITELLPATAKKVAERKKQA